MQRTVAAGGTDGRALQRAEVHDRLIVACGPPAVELFVGQRGEGPAPLARVDGKVEIEQAREHTVDVAVDDGVRCVAGDRADGRRRVVAHAFERPHIGVVGRKPASVKGDDLTCRGVKIPRPAVIAQSLPELQHLVLGCCRQGADVGEPLGEAQVVVRPLCDAGLLEDDLRKPDAVGVAGLPPGQVASVGFVPVDEYVGDPVHPLQK